MKMGGGRAVGLGTEEGDAERWFRRTASADHVARPQKINDPTANFGFEAELWAAADALRNNIDAAEYKASSSA